LPPPHRRPGRPGRVDARRRAGRSRKMKKSIVPRQRTVGVPTLVVGAGKAGTSLARDLTRVRSFGLTPVGVLDDDPDKQDHRYRGTPVLGTLDDLEAVLQSTGAEVVVIAIPSMTTTQI